MFNTLLEAITQLRLDWHKTIAKGGDCCPVCDRWGKVYKRPINENMAFSVAWLAFTNDKNVSGWTDVPRHAPRKIIRSNQLPTMRWWGLVERNDTGAEKRDVKHMGMWRVTEKGAQFARGEIKVPKYVYTYNEEVIMFSEDDQIFIHQAGGQFSYSETMAEIGA